jgi:hypothetical protein
MAIQSWTTSLLVFAQDTTRRPEHGRFTRPAVHRPFAAVEPCAVDIQHREDHPPHHPMRLLADGVPLSLLVDLASPTGPDSDRVAAHEGSGRKSGQV